MDRGAHTDRQLNKTVVLEEYGSPNRADHAAAMGPWQEMVLKSRIAMDQVWQFGPANLSFNATENDSTKDFPPPRRWPYT